MPFNLNAWKRVQGLGDVQTGIHAACQNKNWQKVIKLLKENPERAKQKAPGAVLPLHLALEQCAPLVVIEALLAIYPKGIKKKTERKAGGFLPLHYVMENIRNVEYDYFEYILSLHPKASKVRTAKGLLPLHMAAIKGAKLPVFKILIKKNDYACDLKTKGKNKKFALRICAENNAALKVRKLIYDNMDSESVITILEGHLWGEALKLLKQSPSRARVRRPKDGKNVLQVALLNNAPENVCLKILEVYPEGAKHQCKISKSLPIHDLCTQRTSSIQVVEALIKTFPSALSHVNKNDEIPLHTGIKNNLPVEMIKVLVQHDMKSLRHVNSKQNNSIHIAVSHAVSFATIQFLIEADPANDHKINDLKQIFFPRWNKNVQRTKMDKIVLRGVTPGGIFDTEVKFKWAEFYKRQDDDRRKMRAEDINGWYPDLKKGSKYAVVEKKEGEENEKEDGEEGKKEEKKDENEKKNENEVKALKESPIHSSSRHGHIGIVKLLLAADEEHEFKSVLVTNDNNDTPLHLASMYGHPDCVKELLNTRVCDLNGQNKQEETPESLAELNEWREIIALFTRYKQVGWLA